jgi:hypothetical protein
MLSNIHSSKDITVKSAAYSVVEYLFLLFPWSVFFIPIVFPVILIFWGCNLAAASYRVKGINTLITRLIVKFDTIVRCFINVYSIATIIVCMNVLFAGSKAVFIIFSPLTILTAHTKFRRFFPPLFALTTLVTITVFSTPQDQFQKNINAGRLQPWLKPVLVKKIAEPECVRDYPHSSENYQVRGIAFEPDESALYTAVITDNSRDKQSEKFLSVFKIGLRPGVRSLCFSDKFTLYATLDPESRRLYTAESYDNFIRVLDADTFKLLDTWKVRDESFPKDKRFTFQESLLIKKKNIIVALCEGNGISSYNLQTGKADMRYSFEGPGLHSDFAFDPSTRILYTANDLGPLVRAISMDEKKLLASSAYGTASWGIFYRPGSDSIYVTDLFLGLLKKLDKNTLKTEWSKYLGAGVRPVLVDKTRGIIIVGDYLYGNLFIVSERDPSKSVRLRVLTGVYQIVQSPVSNRVFLGTKSGIFELDFNKLPTLARDFVRKQMFFSGPGRHNER